MLIQLYTSLQPGSTTIFFDSSWIYKKEDSRKEFLHLERKWGEIKRY